MAQEQQNQANEASRGDNAKRYGKIGLLIGAVAGLLTGGGLAGMVQMGLLAAGAGAVGGAATGNKINPIADKVLGMIPGFKKSPKQQAPAAEPELERSAAGPVFREVQPEQAVAAAPAVAQENFRAVGSIDPSVLASARQNTGTSLEAASKGMDPNAAAVSVGGAQQEWVSRQGAKPPTHQGSAMSH